MSKQYPSLFPLLDCIAAFFGMIYAICLLILALLLAIPIAGVIIYLCASLLFPADWVIPITAAGTILFLLITALSAWYEW